MALHASIYRSGMLSVRYAIGVTLFSANVPVHRNVSRHESRSEGFSQDWEKPGKRSAPEEGRLKPW